jgi:hypothetical protein
MVTEVRDFEHDVPNVGGHGARTQAPYPEHADLIDRNPLLKPRPGRWYSRCNQSAGRRAIPLLASPISAEFWETFLSPSRFYSFSGYCFRAGAAGKPSSTRRFNWCSGCRDPAEMLFIDDNVKEYRGN